MATRRGTETGRRQRVADVVAAHVEPLTRFRIQDLRELGPEQESWAEITVTTRQRVELDWIVTAHPGALTDEGIEQRADRDALETELQHRLGEAERTVPALIHQWAHDEGGRYRRLLPGGLFTAGLDAPLAATETCPTCQGRTRQACPDCEGGHRPCARCHAGGRIACESCRGLGRLACTACHGQGRIAPTAPPAATATEPAATSGGTTIECAACAGQGWQSCGSCAGLGQCDCPDCAGRGQQDCSRCGALGEIACADCQASGLRHLLGRLREQIVVEDQIEIHHPDPGVAASAARHFTDPVEIGALAALEAVRYTTAPYAVQAVHRLRLPVRQVPLQIGAQPLTFTACGQDLRILDFQHVVSLLLALDLQTLERNTLGSGRHLLDALTRFLASPLNTRLAVGDPAALPGQDDDRVDRDYPEQARALMRRATERLWAQRIWRPSLALLALGTLVAGALVLAAAPALSWPLAALGGAGCAIAGWVATDWRQRQRLATDLGREAGGALVRPLRRAPVWRRTAALSLAAALVAGGVAALSATRLPPVRERIAQQQQRLEAARQIERWAHDGRDYRLRRYPDAALLRQAADGGSETARLVRAWSLLLGIDGQKVDAGQARELLDTLTRGPQPPEPAVLIGQARATLLLDGRSVSALEGAAAGLESIQESQVPEATYTIALLRLAPAVVARRGAAAGLEALQQAADMGHPSACLDLGRRLAAGQGLKRDPVAARRYLAFAASRGVPGAPQAATAAR